MLGIIAFAAAFCLLENDADIDMAYIYIDCCERIGKFEESKESINLDSLYRIDRDYI